MRTHYKKAIKEQVNGFWFDSKMEATVARMLIGNKIGFKPHQKFEVFGRDGEKYFYEIDFLLDKSIKFAGIPGAIKGLEVKGWLTKKDIHRIDALQYCHFINCWIVTQPLIEMWQREGMLWVPADRNRMNGRT